MKKTDLPNCPQWLLDADTRKEDIRWNDPARQEWIVWDGGEFRGGWFMGGEFRGGQFMGGWFMGGWFMGGATSVKSKYIPLILDDGRIKVGCKEMTAAQWIAWLRGKEVFNTPRNTPAFSMIRAHILATITYQREMVKANKKQKQKAKP